MSKKCPKCGKYYVYHSSTSRIDGSDICPLCGHKEALDVAVEAGVMSKEDAENIYAVLSMQYK